MSSYGFWKPSSSSQNGEDSAVVFPPPNPLTPLAQQRMLLPIYRHKKQILYAMEQFEIVVIVGETGCGKSTQLPQYFVEGGWAENGFSIVCTQPQRIAALSLAQRVSQEVATCNLGTMVSCSVPFQDETWSSSSHSQSTFLSTSTASSIKYVTDEILLQEAWKDPLLSSYSVVIVDDAHEHSAHSDLVLGLLKKIRRKRPQLRVVCCSATMDAESFVEFFDPPHRHRGNKKAAILADNDVANSNSSSISTIISVDGRQHPVDIYYLTQPCQNYLQSTLDTCAQIVQRGDPGDILCFLPTAHHVHQALRMAQEQGLFHHSKIDLLPLHGSLPHNQQLKVFTKAEPKKRVIIFATAIAETSITVPGIRHVIDSGLTQLHYFDPSTGLERWIVTPISQASACQRTGRAGRVHTTGNKCYRLYTESLYSTLALQTPPELVRTNLTQLILTLKALGVDNVLSFDLMNIPPVESLSHGLETLFALGAMNEQTQLTSLGRNLSRLAVVEPRMARMLLMSLELNCAWDVVSVASALLVVNGSSRSGSSLPNLWTSPPSNRNHQLLMDYQASMAEFMDPSGDHLTYVNILAEFEHQQWNEKDCRARFLNYTALRRCREIHRQLCKILVDFSRETGSGQLRGRVLQATIDHELRSVNVRRCVCAGYFFNVAKLANDGRYYTLRKQIAVTPSPSSTFSMSSPSQHHSSSNVSTYIIFGESVDGSRGGIELRSVSSIEAKWLRELAPHYWK